MSGDGELPASEVLAVPDPSCAGICEGVPIDKVPEPAEFVESEPAVEEVGWSLLPRALKLEGLLSIFCT